MLGPLLWLGGWWRELGAPLAWLGLAIVLVANAVAPGTCRAFWEQRRGSIGRLALLATGIVVVLLIADLALGALTPRQAVRSVVLFGAQAALYQRLPSMLLALAGTVLVLWFDWRRVSAPRRLERTVWPGVQAVGPGAVTAVVALLAMIAAGSFGASLWPDAMRGWGRADPADAQRFSYYASFVNRALPADKQIESVSGFEPGPTGWRWRRANRAVLWFAWNATQTRWCCCGRTSTTAS